MAGTSQPWPYSSAASRGPDVDVPVLVVVEVYAVLQLPVLIEGLLVAPYRVIEAEAISAQGVIVRDSVERAVARRLASLVLVHAHIRTRKVEARGMAVLIEPDHVVRVGDDLPADLDGDVCALRQPMLLDLVSGPLLMSRRLAHGDVLRAHGAPRSCAPHARMVSLRPCRRERAQT